MPENHKRKAEIAISSIEADIFRGTVSYSDKTLTAINKLLSIWGMTALQHSALKVIYVHDTDNSGIPSGEIGMSEENRLELKRLLDLALGTNG